MALCDGRLPRFGVERTISSSVRFFGLFAGTDPYSAGITAMNSPRGSPSSASTSSFIR